MNVTSFNASVSQDAAAQALQSYKASRAKYDARDSEIEKIYRAIARGKTVISVNDAIVRGGIDARGLPRLAIMRADQEVADCRAWYSERIDFGPRHWKRGASLNFQVPWSNRAALCQESAQALLPRIPPQHRPAQKDLYKYHLLWEANWTTHPRDPYLLQRIAADAWIVLAGWDLTDVELSVLRRPR